MFLCSMLEEKGEWIADRSAGRATGLRRPEPAGPRPQM
jgi:hypothetical protein